jgi:hypothetical protein
VFATNSCFFMCINAHFSLKNEGSTCKNTYLPQLTWRQRQHGPILCQQCFCRTFDSRVCIACGTARSTCATSRESVRSTTAVFQQHRRGRSLTIMMHGVHHGQEATPFTKAGLALTRRRCWRARHTDVLDLSHLLSDPLLICHTVDSYTANGPSVGNSWANCQSGLSASLNGESIPKTYSFSHSERLRQRGQIFGCRFVLLGISDT